MRFLRAIRVETVGLSLLSMLAFAGCSTTAIPVAVAPAVAVSGNWQIASSAASAGKLPMLSGELTGLSSAITGTVHSHSAMDCIPPSTPVELTGAADAHQMVTLSGAVAGGKLSITGSLAADGRSIGNAAYTVVGGSCAFAAPAVATVNAYSSITGNYTGGFSDANGQVITIAASLTQNPSSDPNGNFQLSGTATFPNNTCFNSPVSIANSQVTGGSFSLTYKDSVTTNSVTASGTFSTDGLTLTATNWALTGPCGPDSGTGSLTR